MKKITTLLLLISIVTGAWAQDKTVKVQAFLTYKFTKLLTWEEDDSEAFHICVYGNSDFYREMKTIAANYKVNGKEIKVEEYGSIESISACHMLYVTENDLEELNRIWEKLSPFSSVLITNGAPENFKGTNINFVVKEGKQRFEIYPPNLSERKIKVSQELLKLGDVKKVDK